MKTASWDNRILESLNTAVLVFDPALRLSYLNPAGEMLLALSARQALRQRLPDLLPGTDGLAERLEQALSDNQPYSEHELHLHLPAGRDITVDCVVTPVIEPRSGLLVELTQVDRTLRIAREENLLEQHQAARQLVRGLAHEIKNPLG
ncbi:MAG: PAS domain-containing protein, partial [Gammaproteobacteria bacterium]